MSDRSVVIHGHFYQPPRENPWLEVVEREPSAAPFHDWNERIEQECYRAVAAARISGGGGRILRLINAYQWISFDFGPTLLEWLEHAAPDTYRSIIEADRASVARLGHGNALATPYHHAILPLSSHREKVTEVRWGIADFQRRFGRAPAGMWLPETAVDDETLDVLAQCGIAFTVLAPNQVRQPPPAGRPGLVRTAGGRSIAVFVYDGGLSHDVAFGPLVRDADLWVRRLHEVLDRGEAGSAADRLVSIATDGETYGHHHHFGEMALARTIEQLSADGQVRLENYASWLARHPAQDPVEVVAPSSWSCAHGVERWRSDCGCRSDPSKPTQQTWRTPLREGLSWLTAECHALYDREAPAYLRNPAVALAGYGEVMGQAPEATQAYALQHSHPGATGDQVTRAAELLELERGALRSLTSCAWFFDDIGGIEALQGLRYAAWAIAMAGLDAHRLEEGLARRLAPAVSNAPSQETGRDLFCHKARPHSAPEARIGAGLVATLALAPAAAESPSFGLARTDSGYDLVRRRTGRVHPFQAELEHTNGAIRVTISARWLTEPITYGLEDLPEPHLSAIRPVLREGLLRRVLASEELHRLAAGEQLRPLVRRALSRTVAQLDTDEGAGGRLVELLDLLEELGQAVPFEVQTVFYRIWQAGRTADEKMAALAGRLGFVVTGPRSGPTP